MSDLKSNTGHRDTFALARRRARDVGGTVIEFYDSTATPCRCKVGVLAGIDTTVVHRRQYIGRHIKRGIVLRCMSCDCSWYETVRPRDAVPHEMEFVMAREVAA